MNCVGCRLWYISHQEPTAKLLLVYFSYDWAGDLATIYYGGSDDSFTFIRCMSTDRYLFYEYICTGLLLTDSLEAGDSRADMYNTSGAGDLHLDWLRIDVLRLLFFYFFF